MRIFYVGAFPPKKGGLSFYGKKLVEGILKATQDSQVYVFTQKTTNSEKDYVTQSGRLMVFRVISQQSLFYGIVIVGCILRFRPHILHVNYSGSGFPHPYNFLLIELVAKLLRTRLVLTMHTVLPHQPIIERILIPLADTIILMTESSRRHLFLRQPTLNKRIRVIPHGATKEVRVSKEEALRNIGIKARFLLLTVGFISPRKGLEYAIESMKLVSRRFPKSHLLIVGEPHGRKAREYLTRLQQIRRRLKLERSITIRSEYIDEDQLASCFSAADALILPYSRQQGIQGCSAVFHLAASYLVPTIATNIDILAEDINESRGGIIVEPEDSQELARIICIFLSDPTLRKKMSSNLKVFIRNCSWEKVVRSIIGLYNTALA